MIGGYGVCGMGLCVDGMGVFGGKGVMGYGGDGSVRLCGMLVERGWGRCEWGDVARCVSITRMLGALGGGVAGFGVGSRIVILNTVRGSPSPHELHLP